MYAHRLSTIIIIIVIIFTCIKGDVRMPNGKPELLAAPWTRLQIGSQVEGSTIKVPHVDIVLSLGSEDKNSGPKATLAEQNTKTGLPSVPYH